MKFLIIAIVLLTFIFLFLFNNSSTSINPPVEEIKKVSKSSLKEEKFLKTKNFDTTNNLNTSSTKKTIQTQISYKNNEKEDELNENDEELNSDVANILANDNIKPMFKHWKKIGNVKYNVFSLSKNTLTPPAVPVFVDVKIDNKKVSLAVEPDKENFLAIKRTDKIEVKKIKANSSLIPPQIKGE